MKEWNLKNILSKFEFKDFHSFHIHNYYSSKIKILNNSNKEKIGIIYSFNDNSKEKIVFDSLIPKIFDEIIIYENSSNNKEEFQDYTIIWFYFEDEFVHLYYLTPLNTVKINYCQVTEDYINSVIYLSKYFHDQSIIVDSDGISQLFGVNSAFFNISSFYLEKYINDEKTKNNSIISNWVDKIDLFYEKKNANTKIFIKHSYFSLFLKLLLINQSKYYKGSGKYDNDDINRYYKIIEYYKSKNISFYSKNNIIFDWVLCLKNINKLFHSFFSLMNPEKEDILSKIYQDLISISTRHALGEYYTPKELITLMIEKKLVDNQVILDPSCGTGSFLTEILLNRINPQESMDKPEYLELNGIDLNPIAAEASYINLIILLRHFPSYILDKKFLKIQIFNTNALFPDKSMLKYLHNKINLVIGNPPWVNLSGFDSNEYKNQLKILADEQNILFGIESKNTEICSIFFFRSRELYLIPEKGVIFFVVPASILNGRQHIYFRYFSGFSDIEVWKFDKDIFRIHSICLYGRKIEGIIEDLESIKSRLKLKCVNHKIEIINNNIKFNIIESSVLIPFFIRIEDSSKRIEIGRYNPENKNLYLQNLTPEKSFYYKLVKGGIRIVPRRWLVLSNGYPLEEYVKIYPDMNQQAKEMWKKPPYTEYIIEKSSIKPFLKSQFLIPFKFIKVQYAFLPITYPNIGEINSTNNSTNLDFFDEKLMPSKSRKFYNLLDTEFRKLIKRSASMKTLSDNITYNGRLKPSTFVVKDKFSYLVVHNSIGSIVKAAIVTDPLLLDNSLYYYPTNDIHEAYYLIGILNSTIMTQFLKMIGSTGSRGSLRNIHKNPYNFPIKKFVNSEEQKDIARMAKKLEKISEKIIASQLKFDHSKFHNNLLETLQKSDGNVKIRTIQKNLLLDHEFLEIKNKLDKKIIESLDIDLVSN